MKAIVIGLLMMSSNLYAVGYQSMNASYTIFSNVGGGQVYYNCDSVENRVEDLLEEMGARNIRVRCSGGLDRFGRMSTSAHVRANFEALSYSMPNDGTHFSVKRVEVRERDNCHLYNTSVRALAKYFETSNVSTSACFRPGDRTRISLNVLKE